METLNNKETKQKGVELAFRLIGVILLVATFIGAYLVSKENPEISFGKIAIWALAFIIIALILIFGFTLYSKLSKKIVKKKEERELPEPMAREDLLDIVLLKSLKNKYYMNEVKRVIKDKFATVDAKDTTNKVFVAEVESLYPLNNRDKVFVVINAHYSSKFMSVLFNPTITELNSTIQAVGGDPIDKLNVIEKEITDDFGKRVYTKETKHIPKDKEDEDKKKEADIE